MVSKVNPSVRLERRSFCIKETTRDPVLSSSSSSASTTVTRYCGLVQNVSVQTVKSASHSVKPNYCICGSCTIVTLALPDTHSSLPHHRWGDRTYAAQHRNDLTPLTDIDSPAATAPPKRRSSKLAINRSDFPILNVRLLKTENRISGRQKWSVALTRPRKW